MHDSSLSHPFLPAMGFPTAVGPASSARIPIFRQLLVTTAMLGLAVTSVCAQAPTPPSPPPPGTVPEAEPPRIGTVPSQAETPPDRTGSPLAPETAPPVPPTSTPGVRENPNPTPAPPPNPSPDPYRPQAPRADSGVPILREPRIEDIMDLAGSMGLQVRPLDNGTSAVVRLGDFNTLFSLRANGLKMYAGFTGYQVSLEEINDWNRDKRFSTAYLDPSGDPCLEHDIDFEGGVAIPALRAVIDTFGVSVATFAEHLSDDSPPESPTAPDEPRPLR